MQFEDLFIKAAIESDPVWLNTKSRRAHLHYSGGICTQTKYKLSHSNKTVCREVWKKNYLSHSAMIQNRDSIRIHCEELTGQTDDQFERQ